MSYVIKDDAERLENMQAFYLQPPCDEEQLRAANPFKTYSLSKPRPHITKRRSALVNSSVCSGLC